MDKSSDCVLFPSFRPSDNRSNHLEQQEFKQYIHDSDAKIV
jgi:hypothetical protein